MTKMRSLSLSDWYSLFQFVSIILLFLTFAVGAAAIITGLRVNKRSSLEIERLKLDSDKLRLEIAQAKERTAEANLALAKIKTPRALPPEAVERMKSELTFFKGIKFDLHTSSDGDSLALMNSIDSALRECGWSLIPAFGIILLGGKAGVIARVGLGLEILEEDSAALQPPASTLGAILNKYGLPTTINVVRASHLNRGAIHVMVGSKPLN